MDAFYASVEQRDFPHLKGQPVVVGGSRERRGVVAAASYEARRFGIRSAMSMGEAWRRCPHLKRQPVRMEVYVQVSRQIRAIFTRYTDKIEPLSIDEAFLDLTRTSQERQETATRLAYQLKADILRETGLTASAGVAPNKFLAKIASDMHKPDGLTVVQPHEVQQFLDPLPVKKIWGVGPAPAARSQPGAGGATVRQSGAALLQPLPGPGPAAGSRPRAGQVDVHRAHLRPGHRPARTVA
jgi:DNA polymerase-4